MQRTSPAEGFRNAVRDYGVGPSRTTGETARHPSVAPDVPLASWTTTVPRELLLQRGDHEVHDRGLRLDTAQLQLAVQGFRDSGCQLHPRFGRLACHDARLPRRAAKHEPGAVSAGVRSHKDRVVNFSPPAIPLTAREGSQAIPHQGTGAFRPCQCGREGAGRAARHTDAVPTGCGRAAPSPSRA
jgi:hypothetical protein